MKRILSCILILTMAAALFTCGVTAFAEDEEENYDTIDQSESLLDDSDNDDLSDLTIITEEELEE